MSPRQIPGACLPALALATAFVAGCATDTKPTNDTSGYLTTYGDAVRDSFGDCWHTREWRAGMRFSNCEPAIARAAATPIRKPPALERTKLPAPRPQPIPFRLSTDTLFDFDSTLLKPEGRAALDKLEAKIGRASYRSVEVIGHTDRIGAPVYNRELSERRAQAVRDYLAAQGLDALKIDAKGVGASEPVTARGRCLGLPRERLIECLQPDRYAEVTVTGTAADKAAMR
jgi:OmpA-OmpF porin, OOP family